MKIIVAVVLLLVSCTPMPTLEELESEATMTGDWSRVEKRERIIRDRLAYDAAVQYCKEFDKILLCHTRGVKINVASDCGCIAPDSVWSY